jgi:hypothetical protein
MMEPGLHHCRVRIPLPIQTAAREKAQELFPLWTELFPRYAAALVALLLLLHREHHAEAAHR